MEEVAELFDGWSPQLVIVQLYMGIKILVVYDLYRSMENAMPSNMGMKITRVFAIMVSKDF